jgi:hypothetical protein
MDSSDQARGEDAWSIVGPSATPLLDKRQKSLVVPTGDKPGALRASSS